MKGFIRYADLERELKELEEKKRNGTFDPHTDFGSFTRGEYKSGA